MTRTSKITGNNGISCRLQVICHEAGFITIEDLISRPDSLLLKLRGFGRKMLGEVTQIREMIQTAESDDEEYSPWHDAGDLPENDGWYLVVATEPLTNFAAPFIGIYDNGQWSCKDTAERLPAITKWMSIPEY